MSQGSSGQTVIYTSLYNYITMRKTTLSYMILTISILLTMGYAAAQQSHPYNEITLPPITPPATIPDTWTNLNADYLDGYHALDILSAVETYWEPNGVDIYYTGGNVGIGTNSPVYPLDVTGNARVTESIFAGSFIYSSSDLRLKTDVKGISSPLEKVLRLEGVTFRWKDSGEPGIGLIAQDVEEVFPEIVSTDQNSGMKSIGYGNLVAPLIEAIKEQQSQIEQLRQEIEALKSEC